MNAVCRADFKATYYRLTIFCSNTLKVVQIPKRGSVRKTTKQFDLLTQDEFVMDSLTAYQRTNLLEIIDEITRNGDDYKRLSVQVMEMAISAI